MTLSYPIIGTHFRVEPKRRNAVNPVAMSLNAVLPLLIALLLVETASAAAAPAVPVSVGSPIAAGETPADGRWHEHQLSFTYSGFTTKYSCDGLADKVRLLLRSLGARPGFKVTTYGCAALYGSPTEFPRVKLQFATLQPAPPAASSVASAQGATGEAPTSAAVPPAYGHVIGREAPRLTAPGTALADAAAGANAASTAGTWRQVRFDRDRPRRLEQGDCELLEQFRDRVLPLFSIRAMDDHTRCIPYQVSGASLSLSFEVFAPVAGADTVQSPTR